LGGNTLIKLDTRLIVSTNKSLAEEVKKGSFREDLYYRLLGLPIELPPLRQRGNDILVLSKYFADVFCEDNDLPVKNISLSGQEKLMSYGFPGNVRELKAVVELAVVLSDSVEIGPENINFNASDPVSNFLLEDCSLEEYNRRIISYFLKKNDNNVLITAKKLNIGKSTIYRMLKNHEL
ncbi:MAG: sigma 54-interacting transcriptional regulator, partial [Bacteroidales bacterium]|jgi:DNA-binding NtrC family response regulator